ncbi:MAG: hypothetical protein RMJ67_09825 [Elusimicrobiota bacterium]|nr:hypothetical protein [Endomicrobiia bacterium]MDW8166794.1 hypothetical protein [Elusimicrobiota bacterium]
MTNILTEKYLQELANNIKKRILVYKIKELKTYLMFADDIEILEKINDKLFEVIVKLFVQKMFLVFTPITITKVWDSKIPSITYKLPQIEYITENKIQNLSLIKESIEYMLKTIFPENNTRKILYIIVPKNKHYTVSGILSRKLNLFVKNENILLVKTDMEDEHKILDKLNGFWDDSVKFLKIYDNMFYDWLSSEQRKKAKMLLDRYEQVEAAVVMFFKKYNFLNIQDFITKTLPFYLEVFRDDLEVLYQ